MGDKRNTKKKPVKPADVEETREEMREAIPALLNEYLPDSVTEVRERAIADGLKPDPETESLADGVKRLSPSRLVLNRFFRSKLSVIGLAIIVFLFAFSFLGPLFTAWGETEVDEVNENGRLSYVERIIEFTGPDGETYEVVAVSETIYLFDTTAPPSLSHIFGTDEEAMDVLTRTMYGGQKSLLLGFLVVFLSTFVGVVFGGLAGYFGKWVDNVIMRVVDVFNCLPTLPILLIASALLDALGVDPKDRIYWLMLILTVFNWAGTARMVRGQILSL
ncbi:MAG: ABC transporter permease, partial [Clostridiales bacterium]|nr:ABC transporter permease [Clostridiales bacterium]